jgi:hypothetical protein
MNDAGDALLVNSIVYIARFTQDQAILRAPSAFSRSALRLRSATRAWLDFKDDGIEFFVGTFEPDALADVTDRSAEGLRAWFDANRSFIAPGEGGRLMIDGNLRALGVGYDNPIFFDRALEALSNDATSRAASEALGRYVPDGPGADAGRSEWRNWIDQHRPYLFFSEYGGYRWYIDPLAKTRGIPTVELRGPARADVSAP